MVAIKCSWANFLWDFIGEIDVLVLCSILIVEGEHLLRFMEFMVHLVDKVTAELVVLYFTSGKK